MTIDELSNQIDWKQINNGEITIVDLETTGFDPKEDAIIEIGAVKLRPNQPLEKRSWVLKFDGSIPHEITEITGIDDELIAKEGVPFYKAIGEFKDFVKQGDLVAYNSKFDKGFMTALCEKYNIPLNNYWPCAMLLCRKAFKLSGSKLSDVADHLGLDTTGAHRAMFDCELTMHCYLAALIAIQKTELSAS